MNWDDGHEGALRRGQLFTFLFSALDIERGEAEFVYKDEKRDCAAGDEEQGDRSTTPPCQVSFLIPGAMIDCIEPPRNLTKRFEGVGVEVRGPDLVVFVAAAVEN